MDKRAMMGIGAIAVVIVITFGALILLSGSTVTVDESQDGSTVEMSYGDTLELKLVGNPTTGFNWQTTEVDDAILRQEGEPEFEPETELIGSKGVVTITYSAVGTGTTPLTLEYKPVAGGDVERIFSITVVVS
ncbi:MAG: protease inhibitor I42 family protein [Acidimicrobiia bacterium]